MARRRVVILGGGCAGALAARALEQHGVELTLINRRPWAPLASMLAAVASGSADPRLGTAPLRPLLRSARLVVADILNVDTVSQKIQLAGSEVSAGLAPSSLPFDDVVVALGSSPGRRDPALRFHGVEGAFALRDRLARALAAASAEESPRKRKILTTAAVLGDGPQACALASELLASLRAATACWPRLLPDEPRVLLLAAGDLLPGSPAPLSRSVAQALIRQGVEVRTQTRVAHLSSDHVTLAIDGREERVEVRTVVDATADAAPDCVAALRDASGRIPVARTLASDTFPGLWALGGSARVADEPPALTVDDLAAQATLLARNVVARHNGAALTSRPSAPPLRVLRLAPDVAVGSLGPLPLPAPLAYRLSLARELARWWPSSSWLTAWLALPAPAGLLAPTAPPAPQFYQTPAPGQALPVPSIPVSDTTTPGLPAFTLPIS